VTAFDPADYLSEDLAFELLSRSPVTLYFRPGVFAETIGRLESDGYQVVTFRSATWTVNTMHDNFAAALSFPSYYGRNLNALNDCMSDVVNQDYGWNPTATGLVIAFSGYDGFVRADARSANVVLDIIATRSRETALVGRRLLCLVQTDDPDLSLEPVGASVPMWNGPEWLGSKRH
jgi:hypothetical protein